MFGKSIKLFKLFGFTVKVDMSWIIIALLVTWSLAAGLFPGQYKDLPVRTYWLMGILGALGLFASIIFHEFSHSLVARRYGLPMKGITLFIFGGVAEMDDEPPSAKAEFMMAIAGPASSIVLAIGFYIVSLVGKGGLWPSPLNGVIQYLALINIILAAFNMVPAFPLDGGRVLRAALWSWKNNIKWATRMASQIGSGFGVFLIALGVVAVLTGNLIGGIWWFLIGMFVRGAAQMSYQQVIIRQALEGEPISRFMEPNPVTAPPSITIQELIDEYVYKHHFKMFPVLDNGKLSGCVTTRQVKEIPREEWSQRVVGDLMGQCSEENTITPDTDSMKALSIMRKSDASRLLVVDGDRLVGIVSLKDMLKFLSLKVELEEE